MRRTLQHAIAAVRLGEPNAGAGHEGLAQVPYLSLRQITAQPSGARHLTDIPFIISCRLQACRWARI